MRSFRSLVPFRQDQSGNVGILFALAMIPVIGGMGAAIDYSMANAYRTDMQKALDSTALALTRLMPANQATLDTKGLQYFTASMGNHKLSGLQLSIVPETGVLKLSAKGYYEPSVAGVLGIDKFEVGARSEAKWGVGKVEVALVLDASLSMNDSGKIQALRAATVDLINVLEASARNPGDAKVGIVAFDGMVNTGYNYNTRPNWVRFDWWEENYGSCSKGSHKNRTDCVADGTCSKSQHKTKSACDSNKGTWTPATWTVDNKSSWNGCVYDRDIDLNYDVNDTEPNATHPYGHASETTAQRRTKYPAAKCYGSPPPAITPLTDNWSSLRTKAQNLTPTGYTNITIGLVWGWHLLSPPALYTEGQAYTTKDLSKYIILMTDGYNTKNIKKETDSSQCSTNGPTCPDVDNRTTAVCNNIRALKNASGDPYIKVYTVRLVAGNATLLRGCATNESMYYDVQSAAQLSGVFSSIGSEIASLHLAR